MLDGAEAVRAELAADKDNNRSLPAEICSNDGSGGISHEEAELLFGLLGKPLFPRAPKAKLSESCVHTDI